MNVSYFQNKSLPKFSRFFNRKTLKRKHVETCFLACAISWIELISPQKEKNDSKISKASACLPPLNPKKKGKAVFFFLSSICFFYEMTEALQFSLGGDDQIMCRVARGEKKKLYHGSSINWPLWDQPD